MEIAAVELFILILTLPTSLSVPQDHLNLHTIRNHHMEGQRPASTKNFKLDTKIYIPKIKLIKTHLNLSQNNKILETAISYVDFVIFLPASNWKNKLKIDHGIFIKQSRHRIRWSFFSPDGYMNKEKWFGPPKKFLKEGKVVIDRKAILILHKLPVLIIFCLSRKDYNIVLQNNYY